MLEEWAWDADVLAAVRRPTKTGEPIPADLVAKMRAADEFGKGYQPAARCSTPRCPTRSTATSPETLTALVRELQEQYDRLRATCPGTHFHASFGHLDGYSAYYTYMWSLVIAKDLFSAFDEDDLFAPEVAHRYRDKVLAAGAAGDAADLVEDFLGRPYTSRRSSAG